MPWYAAASRARSSLKACGMNVANSVRSALANPGGDRRHAGAGRSSTRRPSTLPVTPNSAGVLNMLCLQVRGRCVA